MAFIFGGSNEEGQVLSPETVRRRRAVVDALLERGTSAAPVQHWAQGLARLSDALVGTVEENRLDAAEKAGRASVAKEREGYLKTYGGTGSAVDKVVDAQTAPLGSTPSSQRAGKVHVAETEDDVQRLERATGMAPSPEDIKAVTQTVQGEAAGQPSVGKAAVAAVIANRARESGMTPEDVVRAPGQFEPWGSAGSRARMLAFQPGNPQYDVTAAMVEPVLRGQSDPTGGATHFYAPKAQAALGRAAPTWDNGAGQDIGDHRFFKIGYGGQSSRPSENASQPTASASPQSGRAAVAGELAAIMKMASNPWLSEGERAVVNALATKALARGEPNIKSVGEGDKLIDVNSGKVVAEGGDKKTELQRNYAAGVADPALAKRELELRRAGATNVNVGGGSDKQIFDSMEESAKAARAAATGLSGLREAKKAVEGGIISGAGADTSLALQKIGALFGADASKIQNTETFRAAIAPQVAAIMKATVGSTQISNADREFAEKAAGGSIALDEGSIKRLLGIMERAGSAVITEHRARLDKVYPDGGNFERERSLFGVEMPAATAATPSRAEIEAEMRRRGLLK